MPRALARSLARALHAAGTTRIFGLPGGGPNLDMIGCAEELGVEFVLTHGETAACLMAATYARLTATPGVAVVTRGPGLTSAANGLAQATLDRFPLLLISDTVSAAIAHRTAHQRLDQVALAAPLTRCSTTLGTADPRAVVRAALELARAAPAGAVHLAFDPSVPGDPPPAVPVIPTSDLAALTDARAAVARARAPIVIVGLDAVTHAQAVRAAVTALGCPVLVTYEAKGVVPESSHQYAGLFTGSTLERPLLAQADLIVGIGLDPVEPMPGAWGYDAQVVLLHRYEVETDYFGSATVVVGDYPSILPAVLNGCRAQWPPGVGSRVRAENLARLRPDAPGFNPIDIVECVQQLTGDVLATVDAGAHMLAVMPAWSTDEPGSVLISNGLATMGFALPAAIAMALARPGRRVVCFVGDGGLAMVLGELETLARLALEVTVVVFNDAALTLIALKQGRGQGGPGAIAYGAVDYAAVAAAMGVTGHIVDDLDGLHRALGPAGGVTGPLLVDARIDPSPYRRIIEVIRG